MRCWRFDMQMRHTQSSALATCGLARLNIAGGVRFHAFEGVEQSILSSRAIFDIVDDGIGESIRANIFYVSIPR